MTVKDWLNSDQFNGEIAKALPSLCTPERFQREPQRDGLVPVRREQLRRVRRRQDGDLIPRDRRGRHCARRIRLAPALAHAAVVEGADCFKVHVARIAAIYAKSPADDFAVAAAYIAMGEVAAAALKGAAR